MIKGFNYSDFYLIPNKCVVESRQECDVSVKLGRHTFSLPVFPANMPSVIDEETCLFMARNNMFYTMHRFVDQTNLIQRTRKEGLISSISVGVNEDSYNFLSTLVIQPDYITIDVAHGWSDKVFRMIEFIKSNFNSFVIVGNVATRSATADLVNHGADAIKVGIGGGAACTTKNATGFHIPTATSLMEMQGFDYAPIIADGGIREVGDIAKAIALGATMVMAGSLFAGYDQSAKVTHYYGNASNFVPGKSRHIEGTSIPLSQKGDMNKLIPFISDSLKSSVSYAGGKNLSALKDVDIVMME